MKRRGYLATLSGVGLTATAGCSAIGGETTLSNPTVIEDGQGRRAIEFTVDGEEIGHVGVDGHADGELLDLSTEIWHREGTTVDAVRLRVWMPETAAESPSEVAVVSPVEGDSSPPPSLALYTPANALGTVIELTDLDDLADETISTLELLVRPGSPSATTLAIDATLELTEQGLVNDHYTLTGEFELSFPALAST